ncbi:hypothetical protein ACHAQJ_003377 [Trichoderma viride]
MPRRRGWASAPLFLLFLAPALADVTADFSFYPTGAQQCLSQAATSSKCSGSSVMDLNQCLCGNTNNFIIQAATCIGKNDPSDAVPVYQTLVSACATSNTPLVIAPDDFYGAVSGKLTTTTTTTTTSTTSTTSSSSSTATTAATTTTTDSSSTHTASTATTATATISSAPLPGNDTLSTGGTIGIALGASFGGVGAIAALVYFLLRNSKKKGEEFHPMLPQFVEDGRPGQGAADPMLQPTPSPGLSSNFSEAKRASWVSPLQSPDPYRYSAATWDPSQGTYQGPYAPPGGIVELPPLTASGNSNSNTSMVFEMDGSQMSQSQQQTGLVEVQGDVPPPRPEGR